MKEYLEQIEREAARRKRRWKIGALVVGLFMLVYGLPFIFILVGDSAREEVDWGAYDAQFQLDLDGVELWYHLARYSPLTWGTANQRRADLHADLGQEIYLDGMRKRSRRHFEAAWGCFERAAEIHVSRSLVVGFAGDARSTGQADRVIALRERFPQYADALAFSLRTAYLIEGRFAEAAPLLLAECQSGAWPYLCEQAALSFAVAGDLEAAERAGRLFVQKRKEELESPPAAPDPNSPKLPAMPVGVEEVRQDKLLSARILLARILAKAGKVPDALAQLDQVLEAGQPLSWPVAVQTKAAVLRVNQREAEADRFLLEPGGEQAVRQKQKILSNRRWDPLAVRRAVVHLRAGRAEEARGVLQAHFQQHPRFMRSRLDYPFQSSNMIIDHASLLPDAPLAQASQTLAGSTDETIARVRTLVDMLRCRTLLASHDPAAATACLDRIDPPPDGGTTFGLRYWAAIAGGHPKDASELCAAEAGRDKWDPDLEHKWLLAEMRSGNWTRARELLDERSGHRFKFGDMTPELIAKLLDGIARLSAGQALPDGFEVATPEQLRATGRALPRLQRAMASLAAGDKAAAVSLLGDQNLHYHIFLMHDWVPFARALFALADPSGLDQAHVLRCETSRLAGIVFVAHPKLIWLLAEIASLEPTEQAERTRAAIARHQAAIPVVAELRWGL